MKSAHSNKDSEDVIDLREIFVIVWRRRIWVTAITILFLTAFFLVAFLRRPVYQADALVVPANLGRASTGALSSALGQLGGLAALAGVNVGSGDAETNEALAILKSRDFLQRFIEEKKLLPELFPALWNSKTGDWAVKPNEVPSIAKGYKYFIRKVLSVSQDKKNSLVTVEIEWKDRIQAAEFANELVDRINETMRLRAIANSEASIGYLEKELKTTGVVATQESINRLIEAQVKQRMLANVTPEYVFRIVDKAIPPDVDDTAGPTKTILMIGGLAFGLFAGIFSVIIVELFLKREHDSLSIEAK